MLYAFLCYNNKSVVTSWTKEEDDAVMAKLHVVHQKLVKEGRFGPALPSEKGKPPDRSGGSLAFCLAPVCLAQCRLSGVAYQPK